MGRWRRGYCGLSQKVRTMASWFVRDVSKVANLNDIIYAKILDLDVNTKHIKLSIKATQPKVRYKSNYLKVKDDKKYSDFSPLSERLNGWIIEQLKEKKNHD